MVFQKSGRGFVTTWSSDFFAHRTKLGPPTCILRIFKGAKGAIKITATLRVVEKPIALKVEVACVNGNFPVENGMTGGISEKIQRKLIDGTPLSKKVHSKMPGVSTLRREACLSLVVCFLFGTKF